MKKLMVFLAVMFFAVSAFAQAHDVRISDNDGNVLSLTSGGAMYSSADRSITSSTVVEASGDTDIALAAEVTVYTSYIDISDAEYFSCAYWVYSAAGVAAVTIQIEQSWTTPATDGASDGNYVIPVNMADIVTSLATESTWYIKSIAPAPMPYIRFKITGTAGNSADTIVRMKFAKQI